MSIDLLHDRIRKLKNPSVIDFGIQTNMIPAYLVQEEGNAAKAYTRFCLELMDALKDTVAGVRLSFDTFALIGPDGLLDLQKILQKGREMSYYLLLDGPQILSPWDADRTAELLLGSDQYPCDGLLISTYIGSDSLKPFLKYCKDDQKDIFAVIRSANRSASEIQDLLTGSRHVYSATAEIINRFGESVLAKCSYSRLCGMVGAGSPEGIRTIRSKHDRMFLLVDGLDYPSGNAKNCSYAFDRFGYGAAVCAGPSVTAAWVNEETDGKEYVKQAVEAAERMKRNICRYVTVL